MSLQFVLGPSGYGKSKYVQEFVTREAAANRDRDYLMIVPDQFTMQTQMMMAGTNPDGGILNIDVLSFSRLTHRIFEEVGKPDRVMLDDLGKCLILRRVISQKEPELKVLKKGIHTPGYVEEVKSVLSEFMQYDVRPEKLREFSEKPELNPALKYKLKDFLILYEAFEEALADQYTTKEETLHVLCNRIPMSKILKRSVIVFDGFTGFTPIQISVISTLLQHAKDVIITLPLGYGECVRKDIAGEEFADLFHLTKKTIRDISGKAKELGVPVMEPIYLAGSEKDGENRFGLVPAISYLERNIFRQKEAPYSAYPEEISVIKATDEVHECMLLCRNMTKLITKKGYRYRDIAVVCGDLAFYSKELKKQFDKYNIPHFMDMTTDLKQSPFVSYLRTVLAVLINDYAYRDVSSLIKSGFSNFTKEESDLLDNYLIAKNIRGRSSWEKEFKVPTREMCRKVASLSPEGKEEAKAREFAVLNEFRERFLSVFQPFEELKNKKEVTAREWLTALYRVAVLQETDKKLQQMSERFEADGKPEKALEYSQVFRTVMELFDRVVSLIGDEVVSLSELSEVLDVGYGEIRIGIIPKSVDVLPVCDMIRSRFGEIKALFFLGVNDGNIPSVGAGGGLISDMERTVLMRNDMELAPNRAMESFTEQLYLYQVLTKPSEKLILSYLSVTGAGDSKKPSYLISELKKLFPALQEQDEIENLLKINPDDMGRTLKDHNLLSVRDLQTEFATCLGNYVRGGQSAEETEYTKKLYALLSAEEGQEEWLEEMVDKAFESYHSEDLEEDLVRKVYGDIMKCSVSSLEKFAGCAYAHFLNYGLDLKEREKQESASNDLGNVTHAALESFGQYLKQNGEEFAKVSEERCNLILDEITDKLMNQYGDGLFVEAQGTRYLTRRVKRILSRCVQTLRTQLQHGRFEPVSYEQRFNRLLAGGKTMLVGKIDRIDTCEEGDTTYIKIVDYKSGSKDFEEALFEQGVQLQTAVYLSEALKKYATDHPDRVVKPGAMFYFRMQDPLLDMTKEDEVALEKKRNTELRPTGVLAGEDEVIDLLENKREKGKSEVIPASFKDDGSLAAQGCKSVKTGGEMQEIIRKADEKVASLAGEISSGNIAVSPLVFDKYNACEYCSFRTACGFDVRLSGYEKRMPEGAQEAEEE